MTPPVRPGVTRTDHGLRFTVFAPGARQVQLRINAGAPGAPFSARFALAPVKGDAAGDATASGLWTREIAGAPPALEYVYRVDGGAELIDPCARLLTGGERWGDRSWSARGLPFRPYRSYWTARRLLPAWAERPARPAVGEGERVIYELHVRGFTRHPSAAVAHPGTYLGLIEKLPELAELGVTTLELLPVFEFDETENRRRNPRTGEALVNFWGYSPISFFAPKRSYAAGDVPGAELVELAALVDAAHRAGMEVVLDVVYNHTAEGGGGETDPLRSFRALADPVYYLADPATGRPFDCTGCGNTVNTNHPVVQRMILDSLAYWAEEVGVDGFRFDLAAVFYRGLRGEKLEQSPIADAIAADPRLRDRLLIAEPWDATGFSPPRGFPPPWRIWNGAFRDDLRRAVRGDTVAPRTLALRLGGSPDRFDGAPPGAPPRAIDFVACHDGFTLDDLVSFAGKHNAENGEGGEDGSNFNLSSNHGVEGATDDPAVRALRDRQVRNFLALLLLSRGTPMLLAGDERARTQHGNNNPWCQDNELGWLDWERDDRGRRELVRALIALRRELAGLALDRRAIVTRFESRSAPAHAGPEPALLLFRGEGEAQPDLALGWNPSDQSARLPLPRAAGNRPWTLLVDSQRAAGPVPERERRPRLAAETAELELPPRSLRLLLA